MKAKTIAYFALPLGIATIAYFLYNTSHRPDAPHSTSTLNTSFVPDPSNRERLDRMRELANASEGKTLTPRTLAWNGAWLVTYPGVDPSQPNVDSDGDGYSNHDEMLAGTDPFNGKGSTEPNRQRMGTPTMPAGGPTFAETQDILKEDVVALRKEGAVERQRVEQQARAAGIPTEIVANGRLTGVLAGFDADGLPNYTGAFDIASADSSGVDELWPSGVVTAVSGWATGGTGFNLDGGRSDPLDTTRPYPRLALWEPLGGVRMSHNQLNDLDSTGNPRVLQYDIPASESFHASAVASVLAGSGVSDLLGTFDAGNYSRGIAYGAQVNAWDTVDFQAEISDESSSTPPLRAANNSYGTFVGWSFDFDLSKWRWFGAGTAVEDYKFGAYTNGGSGGYSARELDDRSSVGPYTLLVWAAGNDRSEGPGAAPTDYLLADGSTSSTVARNWNDGDEGGYDSMPPQGSAKNVLTVGAYSDAVTAWDAVSGKVLYSGTSSVPTTTSAGPTDDGRLKPDIVACGTRVNYGTRNPLETTSILFGSSDPSYPADNEYFADEGTSFAAPVATGTVALLLQRRHAICPGWENNAFPIRSSTLKALMIGTATDVGASGPDFITGYGLLNSAAATKLMADECVYAWGSGMLDTQATKPFVKEIHLPQNGEISFEITAQDPSVPIKVTMVWTDPPGSAHAGTVVDPTTKRLKHDLDLRIYQPGTTVFNPNGTNCYKPWQLNPDLTGKTAAARGAAAIPGSLTSTNDDSTNNVEQVVVPSPTTSGSYILKVNHKALPLMSASGQWVSLVIEGVSSPTSVPMQITGMTAGGGGTYALSFVSVPGAVYTLQGSPNLFTWTDMITNISAKTELTQIAATSPPGSTSYYWRIARPY